MFLKLIVAIGLVVFLLHWLVTAVRKRIEFEIEFGLAVAALWATIYLLCFFGGDLDPMLHLPGWVEIGGVVLWLISIVLFIVAVLSLRTKGKPEKGWEETTQLSTGGLHGLVRHPMQLAAFLGAVGIALIEPAAPVLILCLSSAVLAVRAAFAEDTYNVSKFGDGYSEYMKLVPRLNLAVGIWRRATNPSRATDGSRRAGVGGN